MKTYRVIATVTMQYGLDVIATDEIHAVKVAQNKIATTGKALTGKTEYAVEPDFDSTN